MEKLWAKDVKEGEKVKSVFRVARKAIPTAKSGKTYLSLTFHDRTGELEARAFENVEALAQGYDEQDFVEVEGQIGAFQGKPQLRVETIAKVDAAGLDAAEFAYTPPPPAPEPKKPERSGIPSQEEQHWAELLALVDVIVDPFVKTLVRAFVDDEDVASRLRRAPAAKTVHHAYPGGLLEHTVSSLKLAHRLADHYPQVDRDLLVAGAFFHDLGKIRELSLDKNTEYTDEGRLVGHHVMTAQWIHDKARRNGIPRELETQIVHLVLAHHGKVEYGSPRPPMTLEALLTHYIDEVDSRVNSWLNLMGKDGGSKRWTDAQNVYGHHIWRGALPTIQGEKHGPSAEVMTPVIYVPRTGGAQSRPEKKPKQGKLPRPPREARSETAAAPASASGAPAAEARPERPPRPERPERGERPPRPEGAPHADRPHADRPHGDRPHGGHDRGPRGPGGPGDRKPRYMGPRLPGDKGPQARPKNLTHNPFAALAAKLEGQGGAGGGEEKPAEAPPMDAASMEAPPPAAPETAPTGAAQGSAHEQQAAPATENAPAGGSTPDGEGR